MFESDSVIKVSKRDDYLLNLKKQSAANALQQYSILALKSLNNGESPARTRLKMMRILTDIPTEYTTESYGNNIRKKSTASGYSSR